MKKLRPHITSKRIPLAAYLGTLCPILALAQGPITPPGPPGPTMKTLAQVQPRTPISALPFFINTPGSYYLTTILTGIPGTNGITIAANDVSIDLNGFGLFGVAGSVDGILVGLTGFDAYTNIAVANGTIRDWDHKGINGNSSAYNCRFERLHVLKNKDAGLDAGYQAAINHCEAVNNGSYGIYSFNALIESCVANLNVGEGIYAGSGRVLNCSCQSNGGQGVRVFNGGFVSGCLCSLNARSGIGIGVNSVAYGNDCVGNNTSATAIEAGIVSFFGPGRIEGNHVGYSTGYGIMVVPGQTGVVVIKNSTAGSTNNVYSIPAGNDVGPWGNAATSTSPWANIYN